MASDLQEQKKAQALAYDYEGDSKWIEYWANVLMPEDMAAKPEVRRHYQLKYYQRHIVCSHSNGLNSPFPQPSTPRLLTQLRVTYSRIIRRFSKKSYRPLRDEIKHFVLILVS